MKWIATDRNGDMKAFEHMPLNVKGVWLLQITVLTILT